MIHDIMVFEKSQAPNVFEDFFVWAGKQTELSENRDYKSISGASPKLISWFTEAIKKFPPISGEFAKPLKKLKQADYLAEYMIGSVMIYVKVNGAVAKKAERTMLDLACKHGLGYYNFQTNETFCPGMLICELGTENGKIKSALWSQIYECIQTLDSPDRVDESFIVLWFREATSNFVQSCPIRPRYNSKPIPIVNEFLLQAKVDGKLYETIITEKTLITKIMLDYYQTLKTPDITKAGWVDTGDF